MAEQPIRPEAAGVTDSGLFVRNATGLVRGMSQRASIVLNFIPGHPTQTLAAVLFGYLVLFPGANPYLALLIVLPMTLSFSYAFGMLTAMIPRSGGDYMIVSRVHRPVARLHLVVLHDDGRAALERVLRDRVRDERARAALRRDRDGRPPQEPRRLRHEDLDAPWLGVRARLRDDRRRLPDPPRRLALDDPVPVDPVLDRSPAACCSPSATCCSPARARSRRTSTRSRAPTSTRTRSHVRIEGRYAGQPELLVRADDHPRRRTRDGLDLLLLVDVRRRRAPPGEHASRRRTTWRGPASVGLIVVAIFGCDHPPLGRALVHDRRERRWALVELPVRAVVHVPVGCERREHALRDHHRDLLLRVLAADHVAVAAPADAHAVRVLVRRHAAEGVREHDARAARRGSR